MAEIVPLRHAATRTEWLDIDAVSRHAESQVRARSDPELIAEYAHAMLEGAEFPPIVVFEDDAGRHLADGHQRLDAASLAATKDRRRKRRIQAEIRPGSFDDALRYAMQANAKHGKRLNQDDYKRSIEVALERNLIHVRRASEVVPALLALIPGLSASWAQVNTTGYRKDLIAKRDRLIRSMTDEGKTQKQIADELDINQATVARVLKSMQNITTDKTHKTKKPPAVPELPAAQPELAPPTDTQPKPDEPPHIRMDFKSYLPLLDRFELPPPEDEESGVVAGIDEGPTPESPKALAALRRIDNALGALLLELSDLADLSGHLDEQSCWATQDRLDVVGGFLNDLSQYLGRRWGHESDEGAV